MTLTVVNDGVPDEPTAPSRHGGSGLENLALRVCARSAARSAPHVLADGSSRYGPSPRDNPPREHARRAGVGTLNFPYSYWRSVGRVPAVRGPRKAGPGDETGAAR